MNKVSLDIIYAITSLGKFYDCHGASRTTLKDMSNEWYT